MKNKHIFKNDLTRQPILNFDSCHEYVTDEMIEKALNLYKNLDKFPL